MRFLFSVLALILIVGNAAAATVYIDPTCGSSGDGTTTTCGANGPFKTWAEVTWTAGNTYSQKGGTTATGTTGDAVVTIGETGTAGNIITINSYGTGKAIIDGIKTVASNSWTPNDPVAGVYSQASVSNKMWYEDGVRLLYGTAAADLTAGQVFWESEKNYYKPSSGTPAEHTVQIAYDYCFFLGARNYVTINNISMTRAAVGIGNAAGGASVAGTSNSNITITNCTFDDLAWGINIISNGSNSSYFTITGNSLSYIGNGIELGATTSDSNSQVTIANNTITYCSQKKGTANLWRLNTGAGRPSDYQYMHYYFDSEGIGLQNVSSGNIYSNSITGAGRGIVHYVLAAGAGSNNNFYKNYINVSQQSLQFATENGCTFSNNKAYYNVLKGGQYDAAYSGGYTVAVYLTNPSTVTGTNYLYNNTIESTGYVGVGAFIGLSGYTISNNIIYGSNLTLLQWIFYIEGSGSNLSIDYNLYYPASNDIRSANQWGYDSANKTWAQWQAAGFDTHSPSPSDPKFISASNYMLQSDSPAKDAGIDWGQTGDFLGVARQGAAWDIGAYEYFTGGAIFLSGGTGTITLGGSGSITITP